MKIISKLAVLVATTSLASCQEKIESHPAKVTVRLIDDSGAPISGFPLRCGRQNVPESLSKRESIWDWDTVATDSKGGAVFEFKTWRNMIGVSMSQGIQPLRDKYYLTTLPGYLFEKVENGRWRPENPVIEAVLKRKLNPIPMYAKNYYQGGLAFLKPPGVNKNFGYDLLVGDWVSPHGKGRTKDIIFRHTSDQQDTGDFKEVIRVSFSNSGDGLVEFITQPDIKGNPRLLWVCDMGSELKSGHQAPADGYQPVVERTKAQRGGVIADESRPDRNYYFRVRTKLDEQGRVVTAHYGKIYGDFMSFIYYFNPTPNDRNVEFDPTKNLFVPEGTPYYKAPNEYQVYNP